MTTTIAVKDYVGLASNAEVQKLIMKMGKSPEKVHYSGRIVKITSKGRWNLRILLITEKAVYNLMVNNHSVCKRRFLIENIEKVTASRISSEAVFHVPTEYDFRFQTVTFCSSVFFLRFKLNV